MIDDVASIVDSTPYSSGYYEFSVERVGDPTAVNVYYGACPIDPSTRFDYLTTLDAGKVVNGAYTYVCSGLDFIPDGSYDVLPSTRPQKCVTGIRLTPPIVSTFGAAFWTTKQPVVYGFDTTFRFAVLQKSNLCPLQEAMDASKFCYSRGGRGFAFVVQNEGSPGSLGVGDTIGAKINTAGQVSLGYNFPRNLAIEFNYLFDTESGDPNWNHIAVMVPVSRQASEGDNANSADHRTNTWAISDGISLPPLNEGTHKVRIVYDVSGAQKWTELIGNWYSRPLTTDQRSMLEYWANNQLGVLSVYLNDRVVLKTLIDVAQVVQVDPVSTWSENPTGAPNESAPGSAWVGFVAATSESAYSSPVILDWTFATHAQCAGADLGPAVCAIGTVRGDSTPPALRFSLRNIGRVNVQVFLSVDGNSTERCRNGVLNWNEVHPYYLGCERGIAMGPGIEFVSITDTQNQRSVQISSPSLVDRDYVSSVFVRRDLPGYCVIEHESDYNKLYFAMCDCAFCARIFDNQVLYSIFYSHICASRYTYTCSCFEVSQMTTDTYYTDYETRSNPWRYIEQSGYDFETKNMQIQQHTVCRGCKFDHHCTQMFALATCATPAQTYRVGNPLTPSFDGSFSDWNRGADAVDGAVKGDSCDCLDRTRLGEYTYLNTRGAPHRLFVYLLLALRGSADDCSTCLRAPNSPCSGPCNPPVLTTYLHWPAGASCATCVFASASWVDLSTSNRFALRDCVYTAIEAGEDPWTSCEATIQTFQFETLTEEERTTRLYRYLNGVVTHYLAECPGRDLEDFGAVCAPNLYISDDISMQAISRDAVMSGYTLGSGEVWFPAWWPDMACLNAICESLPRSMCYLKLMKIVFDQDSGGATQCYDLLGSEIGCTLVGSPGYADGAVVMDRLAGNYGYTDSLDTSNWGEDFGGLVNKTLEVWAQISDEDTISDLVFLHSSGLSSSSSWGDTYEPQLAVDGDLTTFWQSTTSDLADFEAVWSLDFGGRIQNAQGYSIVWAYRPQAFRVEVSVDTDVWILVDEFSYYQFDETVSSSFFEFNQLRIVMTEAGATRPAGQDSEKFAYGIYEFSVYTDADLARKKPVEVLQTWSYPVGLAFDGDFSTWWSTARGVGTGTVDALLGQVESSVALIRVVFRKGYSVPSSFDIYTYDGASWSLLTCQVIGCNVEAPVDDYIVSFSLQSLPSLSGVRVDVTAGPVGYYDSASIVQISEVEMYTQSTSGVTLRPSTCTGSSGACPALSGDGSRTLSAGSLASYTDWESLSAIPLDESLGILTISFGSESTVAALITVLSPSNTTIVSTSFGITVTVSLAIVVNDPWDLVVQISALSSGVTVVTDIYIGVIKKVSFSGGSFLASTEWQQVGSVSDPMQGVASNVLDGDLATEFRTKLGAPSLANEFSTDENYVVNLLLPAHVSIDATFVYMSFKSVWFSVHGVSATSEDDLACEWTPYSGNLITECPGEVIAKIDSLGYAYLHTAKSFGARYFSKMQVSLFQSSAVDLVDGRTIFGVREVEMYAGFPHLVPSFVEIVGGNSTSASALIDGNFTTTWARSEEAAVTIIVGLSSLVHVSKIEVWWGSINDIPASVTVSVSTDSTACDASPTFGLAQSVSPAVDLAVPAAFADIGFTVPIKCVEITLQNGPATFNISDIYIAGVPASFLSPIVTTTLSDGANLFDNSPDTVAVAPNGLSDHYVLFDLPRGPGPVWGVSLVQMVGSVDYIDPATVTLYLCTGSESTANACNHVLVQIPYISGTERYVFPPVSCSGCGRVSLVFSSSSTRPANEPVVSLSGLVVWSGPNLSQTGTVAEFDDSRGWSYFPSSAVNGVAGEPWVSESDVTSAELRLALINQDGSGYLVLDPLYDSSAIVPMQVNFFQIEFFIPVRAFSVAYKLHQADSWVTLYTYSGATKDDTVSTVTLTGPNGYSFYANYVLISLMEAGRSQFLSTVATEDNSWYSPMFGITTIQALTSADLAFGKSASATGTAVNANFQIGGAIWVVAQDETLGTWTLPSTSVVCGVKLYWGVPAASFSLTYLLNTGDTMTTDLRYQGAAVSPETKQVSVTGSESVVSVSVTVDEVGVFDTVELSALKLLTVYTPASTAIAFTQSDTFETNSPYQDSLAYLIDGVYSDAYHYTVPTDGILWFTIPTSTPVGKIVISWDAICASFLVEGKSLDSPYDWFTIYSTTTNTEATTTLLVLAEASAVRFTVVRNSVSEPITILEISMFYATAITSVSAVSSTSTTFSPNNAIDGDSHSMWMNVPGSSSGSLVVDLGKTYPVKSIGLVWGFTAWTALTLSSSIGSMRQIATSTDGTNFFDISNLFTITDVKMDNATAIYGSEFRYLKITISAAYSLDLSFGISIIAVNIVWDQDLVRGGSSYVDMENSWWDFPATLAGDGDETSLWLSERGESTSWLMSDLGAVFDLAGMELVFSYVAGTIQFYNSLNCIDYTLMHTISGNTASSVVWSGQTQQFQGRCVRVNFSNPVTHIANPDAPSTMQAIFGLFRMSIFNHVGGGGVFGIEAKVGAEWGTIFDTITFSPFQPNQWHMLSNQQDRSANVNGAYVQQEVGMVQIVVTFGISNITMYRNGVAYGTSYAAPTIPWDTNEVRLVFGVRSSAFVGASSATETALMGSSLVGKQVSTLSPYFSGSIKSVALFSQELLEEEVWGLYESASGKRERSCLCYDACPVGSNRMYPGLDVPCSGQGVCRRQFDSVTGLPDGGYCQCSPGFSGEACDVHCSNSGGCCSVDDDCREAEYCDAEGHICVPL